MVRRSLVIAVISAVFLTASSAWADSLAVITSQAGVAATDSASWGQFGPDGSFIGGGFGGSTVGGDHLMVLFGSGSGNGTVAVQCSDPSCSSGGSWAGGFTAGDSLISTNDGVTPTGGLGFLFGSTVSAAGLEVQSAAADQFSVQLVAYTSAFVPLGPGFILTSDASGDPVFIGVQDLTARNIGYIAFDTMGGTSPEFFAADTLFVNRTGTPTVPEPASMLLMGSGLIGLVNKLRQRLAR